MLQSRIRHNLIQLNEETLTGRRRLLLHVADVIQAQKLS